MLNTDFTGCLGSGFELLPGKQWRIYSDGNGFFPKYLKCQRCRVELSTPPENAMTALSLAFIASLIISILAMSINNEFSANKIYVFSSPMVRCRTATVVRGDGALNRGFFLRYISNDTISKAACFTSKMS